MSDIIALQLYTVRDETARDYRQTIRRVAEIGYAGVEFAGYGDLSAQELAALLQETGLQAVGTHVSLAAIEADLEREIDYCLAVGSPFLIVPFVGAELRTPDGMKQLIGLLNETGRRTKERGVTLAYHNHDFEFAQEGGSTFIEQLIAGTDAALVKFELDTFWTAYAGVDPIAFINRYSGRFATLHLKDMTVDRKFTEVGDGTLDIAGYIKAGQAAGVQTYIVENDLPAIASLDSARRSFENLHRSLT